MKKFFYVLIIGMLTMMVGCTSKTDSSTSNPPGVGFDNVSGVLKDTNGSPIAGALVKSSWASATTDASGNWNLGTAPITINSGNIGDQDTIFYAVSVTMTNVTAPVAGSNYPAVVYRNVSSGSTAINQLVVGQKNVTVTGKVTYFNNALADGILPVGTVDVWVTLRYFDNGVYTIPMPAVKAVGGIYTITGVENGANIELVATMAGYTSNTGSAILPATNGAYTFSGNLTGTSTWLKFPQMPDQNNPVMVNAPEISIDGGTTWITDVLDGDFEPSATTVLKWTFTRPIKATAYTANAVEVMNDISVNVAAKTGNVPFTVSYVPSNIGGTDIKAVEVAFATGVSSIYTVDIEDFLDNIKDLDGNDVVEESEAFGTIIFSTGGGIDLSTAAVGPLTLLTATTSSSGAKLMTDRISTAEITFDPISGAKKFRAYLQKIEVFASGPVQVHPWIAISGDFPASQISIDNGDDMKLFEFDGGSVGLMYNLKVRAINSDGELGADQAEANWLLLSQDEINAALGLTGALSFSPRVVATLRGLSNNSGFNAPAAGHLSITNVSQGSTIPLLWKTSPKGITCTLNGGFNTIPTATSSTSAKTLVAEALYEEATFSAYMSKTQIENVANWDIIPTTGGTSASVVTAVLGSTKSSGLAQSVLTTGVSVTPTFTRVVYNPTTRKADIYYELNFSGALSAAMALTNGIGTPYYLNAPLFRFICGNVVDLNGTDLIYITNSGF